MSYQRQGSFGYIGAVLAKVLNRHQSIMRVFDGSTDDGIDSKVNSHLREMYSLDPLLPAAVSLLGLEFPIQLQDPEIHLNQLVRLVKTAPQSYQTVSPARLGRLTKWPRRNAEEYLTSLFPVKPHPAASTKCNVLLSALIKSAVSSFGANYVKRALTLRRGVTYDQACAALLYAAGLHSHYSATGAILSANLVSDVDLAKGLSNAIKALGCNGIPHGAVLTEAQSLQGRGVGAIDLRKEALYRCSKDKVAESVINVPEDDLRRHIRAVIQAELPGKIDFPDRDKWWSKRWQWCVNGSENSLSDKALKLESSRWKRTHARAYRKMAAEAVEADPTRTWDGVTLVSVSEKLEHGKTRAIFACDTLSYFAFARLLDPVQKAWRNKRVLLDPGGRGMAFLARKINHGRLKGGTNLMLDYDDFNSQHTTRAMQLVFEELGAVTGFPTDDLRTLVKSFETTFISIPSGGLERSQGTLMSGHRGTTIINSVLNAAYIRYAIGGIAFDQMESLHTGDDVYILANSLGEAFKILRAAQAVGCRMNASKQSVGRTCAEFLRCAVGPKGAWGYLARAIGSVTCGSWIDASPSLPFENLRNGMAISRALINRSGWRGFGRLLATGWTQRDYESVLAGLFSGDSSLDGSPVYTRCSSVPTYRSVTIAKPVTADKIPVDWGQNASWDYLRDHTSAIETRAIIMTRSDPLPLLVSLSHKRGLTKGTELGLERTTIVKGPVYRPRRHVWSFELYSRVANRGVLEGYPVLSLIKGRLSRPQLAELVALAGGDPYAKDLEAEAFGEGASTHRIVGSLPYSDAAALSKLAHEGIIHVSFPVNL